MRTPVRLTLATAAIGATALLGPTAHAHAPTSVNCSREFCVWTDANFKGDKEGFDTETSGRDLSAKGLDMNISSVVNRSKEIWCLFDGKDFKGEGRIIPPGAEVDYLGTMGFNDKARSLKACNF
ncbi:peptidase inhibitor family I36 protein [Actinomadura oligospora]|uniref:peptidase inhibitor family I36 protein n=1 Tax=Actinomadura oligospora TaxID=111804 RepID=UPI00047AC4A8|nr:peptidase inhibitor family I36 protein [Actinomadura oligospora]